MDTYDGLIIDSHMHPIAEGAPSKWFWESGNWQKQVDDLRRAGISRACGGCISFGPVHDFGQIEALNDVGLRFRDQFPDFFLPGIEVHPRFPEESCREIERCAGHGVRWIGELAGYVMDYGNEYLHHGFGAIYDLAGKLGLPVDIHCSDLAVVGKLCERFRGVNFVLAHPGDGQAYRDRIELVARHRNLYLDLSGTGVMRLGMIRHAIDVAGIGKILFGTDFPVCNPAMYVHCVLYEALTAQERQAVFSGNYLKLTSTEG